MFLQYSDFFDFENEGVFVGYISYTYNEPSLYLMLWELLNPASQYAVFFNPSSMVSNKNFAFGVYWKSTNKNRMEIVLNYVGIWGDLYIPFAFESEEKGGVQEVFFIKKIGKLWLGFSLLEKDMIDMGMTLQETLFTKTNIELKYLLTKEDIPNLRETDTIPVNLNIYAQTVVNAGVGGRFIAGASPYCFSIAWGDEKIGYGVSFFWTNYFEISNIEDSIYLSMKPMEFSLISSSEWHLGLDAVLNVKAPSFLKFYGKKRIKGYEPGIGFGVSTQFKEVEIGGAVIHRTGARVMGYTHIHAVNFLSLDIVEVEGTGVKVDTLNKLLEGSIHITVSSKDVKYSEYKTTESLVLPSRSSLVAGFHAVPGLWRIDGILFLTRTWESPSKTSEVILGTGIGISRPVYLRFSQALFYRIIYLENIPIITLPAVFYGLSASFEWKNFKIDLGVATNTTTVLFYSLGKIKNMFSRFSIQGGVRYEF